MTKVGHIAVKYKSGGNAKQGTEAISRVCRADLSPHYLEVEEYY